MEFGLTEQQRMIREAVAQLCAAFPAEYWRKLDEERAYPEKFVRALTKAGWLAVLIPQEYGGGGLGITEASIVLEEVNRSGGSSAACHAQMYIMGSLLRHGSEEQKRRFLPQIASGDLRLQAFAITEPNSGSDTTRIQTTAVRQNDVYVLNGQKIFISRVQHSDLMLVVARTSPRDPARKTGGLSLFLVDLRESAGGLEVRPIRTMVNHETNALFFSDLRVPAENRIGEEGEGFRYLLDGMNAERILIAAESIGDARWFIAKATEYARGRVVFDRPIGQNQGIQFPIAGAYAAVEAADLMRFKAAALFDQGQPAGAEANMAKLLASEASWEAANVAMTTFGGYGMAVEYDVERKFRETRLFTVAPVSNNLVLSYLAQHVLGLPRSF
jgi:acyl-CoA dehydrogenase